MTSATMLFEKFNEKAIKSVMIAQDESRRLGHNFASTEMLLVGVIVENSGVVGKTIDHFNITAKDARKVIEELLGRGNGVVSNDVPFTPAAKKYLSKAIDEAKNLGADTVDTFHILLAMLKDEDGAAAKMFEKLNADAAQVKLQVREEIVNMAAAMDGDNPDNVGAAAKKALDKKSQGALAEFGTDLTEKAANGEMDPLVGREEEIERAVQILARRQKNNPVMIGEPGDRKSVV